MDEIGNILLAIWNAAAWIVDHWQMIALIFGSTIGTPVVTVWIAKLGCIVPILNKVRLSMEGDHTIGDTEAATLFWMIVTRFLGFWPTVNLKVLDYAPNQQVALLKGYKFVDASYRPEVVAVENGK